MQRTRAKLAEARIGTRVVTYYGFGGKMPSTYRSVHREPGGSHWLELWISSLSLAASAASRLLMRQLRRWYETR